MARISKPARGCLYPLVALALSALICQTLYPFIGVWSYLLWLPLFFTFHLISSVDTFDLWLRKRTKDEHWLQSQEGQQWLETSEGIEWLLRQPEETRRKSAKSQQ